MEMGSPRTVEILEALRWLSLTPGERRKAKPPDLTPLSDAETDAVREALEAAEMGIEVWRSLGIEAVVEDAMRSNADREAGRLADLERLSPLELLRLSPAPLDSSRIRDRVLDWLRTCSSAEAKRALAVLRADHSWNRIYMKAATAILERFDFLRSNGYSEAGAVQRIATQGAPAPEWLTGIDQTLESDMSPLGVPSVPPMPESRVRSLLRYGRWANFVPKM